MTPVDVNRKLYVVGDIDHLAFKKFSRLLTRMEDTANDPIHIVLMSDGGDPDVALAFYDRIKLSPCRISITGIGLVASAASLILVAAKERGMTRNSRLMLHETILGGLGDLSLSQLEKESKELAKFEKHWCKLMAESTKGTKEFWQKIHSKETYLSPEDCLELGIIEEIV